MTTAIFFGLGIGLLNGIVCHASLYWALEKSEKVFYGVWAAGFFYRLAFFAISFWLVAATRVLPLVPAMLSLVAGQFAVGVLPLKRRRPRPAADIDANQGQAARDLSSSSQLTSEHRA